MANHLTVQGNEVRCCKSTSVNFQTLKEVLIILLTFCFKVISVTAIS